MPHIPDALVPIAGAFLIFLCIALAVLVHRRNVHIAHLEDELEAGPVDALVDPWVLQRELMVASDQRLPATPRLTNGSLLYLALMMEELGETCEAMANFMREPASNSDASSNLLTEYALYRFIAEEGVRLNWRSDRLRTMLKTAPGIDWALDPEAARALFDGTTDIAVVNAGFALSCGFPGSKGYAEVVNSNLSKANPETRKIDKDASGKWIKGVNYQEPNLGFVLREHAPVWAHRQDLAHGAPLMQKPTTFINEPFAGESPPNHRTAA